MHDLRRFHRFVQLCVGRTGQLLNLRSSGDDAGVSRVTARAWADRSQTSFVVRLLLPRHTNASKRLIKSPKLNFHDVGLAA